MATALGVSMDVLWGHQQVEIPSYSKTGDPVKQQPAPVSQGDLVADVLPPGLNARLDDFARSHYIDKEQVLALAVSLFLSSNAGAGAGALPPMPLSSRKRNRPQWSPGQKSPFEPPGMAAEYTDIEPHGQTDGEGEEGQTAAQ